MSAIIPDSYEAGILYIEHLNMPAFREWLEAELRDKIHILAGQTDDYPVQAILNHHPYLSALAQKLLSDTLDELILAWKAQPTDWPDSAVRSLLSLAAELRVADSKSKLQSLVESGGLANINPGLHAAVLRAIATLSSNNDHAFWFGLPRRHPEFAGLAFQVLARIAPRAALSLLAELPSNKLAIDGVARKLPAFISEFSPDKQPTVLTKIGEALASLSPESATPLRLALTDEGFDLGDICFPLAEREQKERFISLAKSFADTINPTNDLDSLYDNANA